MLNMDLIKEYLDYRCGIYYWLKSLYIIEPDKAILNSIIDTCRLYKGAEFPEYEEKFVAYFQNMDKRSTEKLSKDIRAEYARLFLGPKHIIASPYESVYTSCSRSIFGQSCIEVRRLYEAAGFEIRNTANIPDDFIGYELEFMYYLSFKAVEAAKEDNIELVSEILAYSNYFAKEHLTKWTQPFTTAIVEGTNMEFFKVVAEFTEKFIQDDYQVTSQFGDNQ